MKHIIIDNFFNNFSLIEDTFKKIKLYNLKEFNKKLKDNQQWPGKRSNFLHKENFSLFNLYNNEFNIKFDGIFNNISFDIHSFIHLRLKKDADKDSPHKDTQSKYTCLVYLSKTNLNSGTYLFSDNEKIITDVKFVQNRAFLFDSRYLHSAYGHHGSSIKDGRLTLNVFYKE